MNLKKSNKVIFATVCKNNKRKLLNKIDAENTKKATKLVLNIFTAYLKEKNLKKPFCFSDKLVKV